MWNKKLNFNLFFYFQYTLLYFLAAFLTKNLFIHYEQLGLSVEGGFLEIMVLKNTGAAFSILKDGSPFLAFFSIVILVLLLNYVINNYEHFKLIQIHSLALLSAGILSNTVERIMDGYVTDYIKLTFVNFPVFNIADVCINIGVALLIISLLFFDKKVTRL